MESRRLLKVGAGSALGLVMLACATGGAQRFPASGSEVTPYDSLKTKLEMKPGQTYLAFMKREVKPALDSFKDVLAKEEQKYPAQYSKWQTDLVNDGQGVAIRIDPNNYIFNVGYQDGSNLSDDLKSGRSYGIGPTHRQSDPTDLAYLTELEDFYKSEPQHIDDFNEAILGAVFNCNASGWERLSSGGQIVATDFIAIYTAESDRHLMAKLNPSQHPWEIDLAAATFVSEFVAATDLVMQNGKLVKGEAKDWWAKGAEGSGIGETRDDRRKLTAFIAQHEFSAHPDVVKSIEKIIGKTDGHDVIQGLFEYLNSPKGPMKLSVAKSRQLTQAVLQYMDLVKQDSAEIMNDH